MSQGQFHRACFGEFELDVRAGTLRRSGVPVPVPPQQFTVLAALVEDPGALVTREQLRARVWGDDSFVDFDAGLNFCIRQLRLALGDTASQPQFIQTVPRRGYRFIAPVTMPAEIPTVVDMPVVQPVRPRTPWATMSMAIVLVLLVAGSVWWSMASPVLSADARIADAHAAHGFVALNDDWDWDVAERSFTRALQLDPGHEVALISMSRLRASQGRPDEAIMFAQRALDAHPESLRALVTLGWSQLFAGDPQSAMDTCRQATARQPQSGVAHHCRLNAGAELGVDQWESWTRLLEAAMNADRPGAWFHRAWLAARLGRQADALVHLRRALDAREPDAMFAPVHPAFVGLRTHPDFIAALETAGLRRISSSAH